MTRLELDLRHVRKSFHGPVFLPGEPGYDEERAGFNEAMAPEPALIVGATDADDVVAAVNFAAAHDLSVSVQLTGHGPASTAENAVLITTRRMTEVQIDPDARRARVQAGVRWQQVIDEAAKYGLGPLNGSSPSVGVVGYTLGGGVPLLARTHGWAADHVHAIDLVTADGQLRRVTADEHPELFWGVRGGKDNFGVAVALEFALFPVTTIYGGGLFFPGESAAEVLHAYRRWAEQVPEELDSSVGLLRMPPIPGVPEPLAGKLVALIHIAYAGDATQGERLIAPLRAIGPRLIDTVTEVPYVENGAIYNDPVEPMPLYERTMALRTLDSETVDALLSVAGPESACPLLMVDLRHLGGALGRQPKHPNAVGNRDAAFSLFAVGVGAPQDADHLLDYGDKVLASLEPWGTGGRVLNFLSSRVPPSMFPDAWSPGDYERLVELKTAYDPRNLFRHNVNIPPRQAMRT